MPGGAVRGLVLLICLSWWPAVSQADEPEPVPAEAWLPALQPSSDVRVQRRFAVKAHQLRLDLGGEWLSRGDY